MGQNEKSGISTTCEKCGHEGFLYITDEEKARVYREYVVGVIAKYHWPRFAVWTMIWAALGFGLGYLVGK